MTSVITEKPKHHQRSYTGYGAEEITGPEPLIPESIRVAWGKHVEKIGKDVDSIESSIVHHAQTTLARTAYNMDNLGAYQSAALSVRDRLIQDWNDTQQFHTSKCPKRVYYLSLEFLLGRAMDNALLNQKMKENYSLALKDLGFSLEDLIDEERDAALGNGGLGRLAACYMDSLATLDYPAWGYGLRYQYGIFQQKIKDGYQVEYPDYWLTNNNPWELPRLDVMVEVRFYGYITTYKDEQGRERRQWEGGDIIQAVAYDTPIPGYDTRNTINIRLWLSKPKKEFDLNLFNAGNYDTAVEEQKKAENITSVLYPNDNHLVGKELRLKQQYFWVAASLSDIVRRFKRTGKDWKIFPELNAIQLNDTHPTLAIVELQRILVDLEGLEWDDAWNIVTKTFAFTNHTILPEAMEKWSVPLMKNLLPRHLELIFDINLFFLQTVERRFPQERDLLGRLSIIEETQPQQVRMAHLAIIGSHSVNGVAELHSKLLRTIVFKDFVKFYGPDKFQNKTNGITPRRWLHQSNPLLSNLITEKLGSSNWLKNLDELRKLEKFVDNSEFRKRWMDIKFQNKVRLANTIKEKVGYKVNPNSMFDIQVKRLHEYKRQFMNILGVIHRYILLKNSKKENLQDFVPRVVVFAGKAAPGYYIAKLVIKLINSVAEVVNNDKDIGDFLKVIFLPDYNVSLAEIIIPASDISQHISTAGTEASGTSNMKFVLNGGIILGTVDGANIEIGEEIGEENIYFFGHLAEQIEDIRYMQRYRNIPMDPMLSNVLDEIQSGTFGDPLIFRPLLDTLTIGKDYYLISADFESYLNANKMVEEAFLNKDTWVKSSILCTARMGKFSSDRSIREYAEEIWNVESIPHPKNNGTI